MKNQLSILGVSLLALSTAAVAQSANRPKPTATAATTTVAVETVRVHPLGIVLGTVVLTGDKKELGEVEDLILDSMDGSVDYLVIGQGGVLGVGEEKYLVPFESVRFAAKEVPPDVPKGIAQGVVDDSAPSAELQATTTFNEERIRKAPKFTKDMRIGPDVERASREAAGLTPEPMQPRAKTSELVCARKIQGTPVLGATHEKIGELDEMVVDPHAGVIAYNVLATLGTLGLGERRFALPWEVTRVKTDADNKVVIGSDLTKDRLAKGPEFESKDIKRMLGAPYLRDVYAYYAIEPYFSRTTPGSGPRTAPQEERKDKDDKR
jgi:sporulation protein YlmC with PRC-barrel domain